MLLADALVLASLADRGVRPDLVLGHSYGEFVALYAAGAWDLATAVRMTQARCAGIEAAVAGGETGMLATDATPELIEQVSSSHGLDLVRRQFERTRPVRGWRHREHLTQLASALTGQGRHAKMLAVPGAFHTPLLSTASRPLEEALARGHDRGAASEICQYGQQQRHRRSRRDSSQPGRQLTTPVRYAQLIGRLAAESPTCLSKSVPSKRSLA